MEPSLWMAGPPPDIQMPPPLPLQVEHQTALIDHVAVSMAMTHPRAFAAVSAIVPKQMITAPLTSARADRCLRSMLRNKSVGSPWPGL